MSEQQTDAQDQNGAGGGSQGDGGQDKPEGLLDLANQGGDGQQGNADQAGSSGDGNSGADGDQDGAAGSAAGDQNTGKLILSEDQRSGVPDKFYDKKTGELKLDALLKAESDLRKRVSAKMGGDVPDKPEGYEFTVADDLREFEQHVLLPGEDGKDPLVAKFQAFAHEKGIGKDLANDLYNFYIQSGKDSMPGPLDVQKEKEKLGPDAQKYIDASYQFMKQLRDSGVFTSAMADEYAITVASADGLKMVQAIREYYGEMPMPQQIGDRAASSASADALAAKGNEIQTRYNEGKIDETQYNREMENLQAEYDKVFGTEAAGSSIVRQ